MNRELMIPASAEVESGKAVTQRTVTLCARLLVTPTTGRLMERDLTSTVTATTTLSRETDTPSLLKTYRVARAVSAPF